MPFKTMNKFDVTIVILVVLAAVFAPMTSTVIWTPFAIGMMPTGSMVPAINVGDVMFVNRMTGVSDIAVGDIIVFCCDGIFPVSHRVVELNGSEIVTMGDANFAKDHPITAEDYIGKVDFVIESSALGLLSVLAVTMSPTVIFGLAACSVWFIKHRHSNNDSSHQ